MLRLSVRQGRRDLLTIALSVVFAPLFVLMYAAMYSAGTTYQIGIVNADRPAQAPEATPSDTQLDAGAAIVAAPAPDQPLRTERISVLHARRPHRG